MKSLVDSLKNFKDKKIIVMGDVILDKYTWGGIVRENPEHGSAPLVNVMSETFALGGAANVANNISSLGASCSLYGVVGFDSAGIEIGKRLPPSNITNNLFKEEIKTIIKQRIMANGEQKIRIDYEENPRKGIQSIIYSEILEILKGDLDSSDLLILSDYNKGFFNESFSQKIIVMANERKVPILVDPKEEDQIHYFKGCTVIRPNRAETERITGIKYDESVENLKKMSHKLSDMVQSEYSVITLGKDGAFSYDRNFGEGRMIGTMALKEKDVTGAGDTFISVLGLAMTSGLGIHDSSKLANYASGIVVGKSGTAIVEMDEFKTVIEGKYGLQKAL